MVEQPRGEYNRGRSGYILAPSILSADFSRLGEEIDVIRDAKYVHIDVMDGAFVPNISFGAGVIQSIRERSTQVFDVHLMVEEPIRYIEDFAKAGADILCVHAEACKHLDRTLVSIKDLGKKAAVALNPATPLEEIIWVLDKLDMILLMSVNPGFGGQSFIPAVLPKITALRELLCQRDLLDKVDIEVDGGIKLSNAKEVLAAGANIIVAGSAVYQGNPVDNIKAFHTIFGDSDKPL